MPRKKDENNITQSPIFIQPRGGSEIVKLARDGDSEKLKDRQRVGYIILFSLPFYTTLRVSQHFGPDKLTF